MRYSNFSIVTDCLILGGILLSIYSVLKLRSIEDSKYLILVNLSENWKTFLISDIFITNSSICPEDSNYMINDYFPGTSKGCKCGLNIPNSFSSDIIYKGNCKKFSSDHCQKIYSVGIERWRKWSGKTYCSRSNHTSYLHLDIKSDSKLCKKSCGIIDSLGNFLCVLENDECPLFKTWNIFKNDDLFEKISNSTVDQNLVRKIFTNFKISQNIPCLDPYYKSKIVKTSYILENINEEKECPESLMNKNYIQIDSFNYKSLLQDNLILDSLMKIPKFPLLDIDYQTNLYAGNYIGIKPICRKKFESQVGKEIVDQMSNIYSIIIDLKLTMINYLFICCVCFLFALVFNVVRILWRSDKRLKGCNIYLKIFQELILLLVLSIFSFKTFEVNSKIMIIEQIYSFLIFEENCFEDNINGLLLNSYRTFDLNLFKNKLISYISVIICVFSVCDSIFGFLFIRNNISENFNILDQKDIKNKGVESQDLELNDLKTQENYPLCDMSENDSKNAIKDNKLDVFE